MKIYLRNLIIIITILLSLSFLFFKTLDRKFIDPLLESNLELLDRHHTDLQADLDFLSRYRFFIQTTTLKGQGRNAATVLNPSLFWPGKGKDYKLLIPLQKRNLVLRRENRWIQSFESFSLTKDLKVWMQSLRNYDYWIPEIEDPLKTELHPPLTRFPTKHTLPDTTDLLTFVKLYLMQGVTSDAPLVFLENTRHLARLLLTSEKLPLVLAGLTILDYERIAYNFYVETANLPIDVWRPYNIHTMRRARQALQGLRAYLRVWTPKAYLEELFLGEERPFGFCAITNEAIPVELALKPQLKGTWPFEHSWKEEYGILDEIIAYAEKHCHQPILHLINQEPSHFNPPLPGPPILKHIPLWRQIFALRASLGALGDLQFYSQQRFVEEELLE